MSTVICGNDDKCKSLLNNNVPSCLKQLVHIKPVSRETQELAKRKGLLLFSFEQVEKLGAEKKNRPVVCYFALFIISFFSSYFVMHFLFILASST